MVKYLEKLVLDEFIDELINGDVNISWWENDDDDKKEDDFDVDKSDRSSDSVAGIISSLCLFISFCAN